MQRTSQLKIHSLLINIRSVRLENGRTPPTYQHCSISLRLDQDDCTPCLYLVSVWETV